MAKIVAKELSPGELHTKCDLSRFSFKTTDDDILEERTIGQERALSAIEFGLNVKSEGFNLYISGVPGTGRNTTIVRAIQDARLRIDAGVLPFGNQIAAAKLF